MAASCEPLLQLRGLTLRRRGGGREATVLDGIDLDVVPGRWTCLLGANGSGKSSLLRYLAAENSPLAGRAAILLQDPDEQIVAGSVAAELALGRPDLDVRAELRAHGLDGLQDLDPRLLSAGQKQRLALAVAAAGAADVLLCDEPTSLQDEGQAAWILDRLQRWRARTRGALLTATCDRREAQLADWLVILADGRLRRQGPAAAILPLAEADGLLLPAEASVPAGPRAAAPAPGPPPGPMRGPVLQLQGVGCRLAGPRGGFAGIDLQVEPGQRIGLWGPNGCGKSTLLAVCAGARRPDEGRVRLAGRALYARGDQDLDHGLAMLAPQFPEYLFCRPTVAQEIALDPALAGVEPRGFLASLGLPQDLHGRNPHDLSSGQRRRLAVGMVVRSGRPLLLLDEPTAALDRRGRDLVLQALAEAPAGAAAVVASHDVRLLEQAGCRILELTAGGLRPPRPGEIPLAGPAAAC